MDRSDSAVQEVFSLPELLELILLQLALCDLKTLLLSQRVNTTFQTAIKSSVNLQRALWFRSSPPTKKPSPKKNYPDINPLLEDCRNLRPSSIPFGAGVRAKGGFLSEEPTAYSICATAKLQLPDQGESWRNMILARMDAKYKIWFWCYEGADWNDVELECEGEVTAREVIDRVLKTLKERGPEEKDEGWESLVKKCQATATLLRFALT